MRTKILKIEGMSCDHCVMSVSKSLNKLNPKKVNVDIGNVEITFDENSVHESDIVQAIEQSGYKVIDTPIDKF
jgi:copper chaperone